MGRFWLELDQGAAHHLEEKLGFIPPFGLEFRRGVSGYVDGSAESGLKVFQGFFGSWSFFADE